MGLIFMIDFFKKLFCFHKWLILGQVRVTDLLEEEDVEEEDVDLDCLIFERYEYCKKCGKHRTYLIHNTLGKL